MKKVIFTILFVIATLGLTAQTVTIGTGTFTSIYPFACYRMDARTQILYTAAELTASGAYAGNITSIAFKFSSTPSSQVLNGFLIRMKNTSVSSLTTFDNTGLSQCLNTSYTPSGIDWQTINLTRPFTWDGTSNLLIDVAYDNETGSSNSVVYATNNPGKTFAVTGNSSGENLYTTTYGTSQNYRPNMQLSFDYTPMTYASSTCTQPSYDTLPVGSSLNSILLLNVVMTGSVSPLTLTQLNLSTNGSTSTTDITAVKVYYTGSNNALSTSVQFGSVVTNPNSYFNVSGTQNLIYGDNYFWVLYDISTSAIPGDLIDAECNQITVSDSIYIPQITAPTGNRLIKAPFNGIYSINSNGSGDRNFTDFRSAVNALNIVGLSGPVTFDVAAGQIFNYTINPAPNNYGVKITATGTAQNPIIFRKSGTGSNPLLNFTGSPDYSNIGVYFYGCDYVTFDAIDVNDAGTSYTDYLDFGYYLCGSSGNYCNYITIQNSTVDLNKNNWYSAAVYESGGGYNHFYNNTIRDANFGYSLSYSFGNEIGTTDGISTITDIALLPVNLISQTGLKIFNNNITNIAPVSSTIISLPVCGIYGQDCSADIYNNTISGINGDVRQKPVAGIYLNGNNTTSVNIFGNSISNLTNNYSDITGIFVSREITTNIYNNVIHDLTHTGSGCNWVTGIYISGGITNNIYNNYLYDLNAPSAYSISDFSWEYVPAVTKGICLIEGTINNVYNYIYNNTVYIDYDAIGTGMNSSAAFYSTANPISIDLRNNIFVNMVDLSGNSSPDSKAVATIRNNTGFNNYSNTSNNNLYYAGTPGAKHYICFDGTNADTTLAQYKAHIATKDQKSVTELPPFINITSLPYDLHLSTTIPTQIENGGTPITSPFAITDDFYGTLRNTLTPDIGAEEGNFTEYTIPSPLVEITLNSAGNVQLSWPPVPGANSYKIYASNTPDNIVQPANLLSTQSGTQYLDSATATNKFYAVVASTDPVPVEAPLLRKVTNTQKQTRLVQ